MSTKRAAGEIELSERYFFRLGRTAPIDEYGLLDDAKAATFNRSGQAFTLQQLTELSEPCILLLGPADAGKSFAVSSLRNWLSQQDQAPRVLYTDIRTSTSRIEPQHWNEWRSSTEKAIWIVDSIDEAPIGWHASDAVIEQIRLLSNSERARLRAIVTCRENEIPSELENRIRSVWSSPLTLRISPPSHSTAREICGAQENLDRALQLIEKFGLKEVAEHPAALKFLGRLDTQQIAPTEPSIWRQIIELLLEETMLAHGKPQTALNSRFAAACRIGFLLEFSNIDEINVDGAATSVAPRLDTLFDDVSEMQLLNAAREAVRTPLFRNIGGLRRVQSRHLREWLAAWQLKELAQPESHTERVREIIGDYDANYWPAATVATLLSKILDQTNSTLKQWIDDQLKHDRDSITHQINALLETIDQAPFAVSTSQLTATLTGSQPESVLDAVLRHTAPTLPSKSPIVQQFILEIAARLKSPLLEHFADSAIRSPSDPEDLQIEALNYLEAIGASIDHRSLAAQINTQHARLLSYILYLGLRARTISIKEVRNRAPRPAPHVGDYRSLLAHEIGEHLDVDSAFDILKNAPQYGTYDYEQSQNAVKRLVQEPELSAERILSTLTDAQSNDRYETVELIEGLLSRREDVRHALYLAVVRRDREGDYVIQNTLRTEDIPWLLNQLQLSTDPPRRLIVDLYRMTHSLHDEAKHEVLQALRQRAPQQLDEILSEVARHEQEMAARFPAKQPSPRVALATVLQNQLDRTDINFDQKLRTLGWLAFGGKTIRPRDVEGNFDELSSTLQERVFDALFGLINQAEPTSVPHGNTIPGNVLFEGAALNAAIQHFGAQAFTPTTLTKWLPTLLRQLENDDVIELVSEIIPRAAIDAYADFIRRDVVSESATTYSAHHAPVRLWGLGLADEVEKILFSKDLPDGHGKASLLHECWRRAPQTAETVALSWASTESLSVDCRNAALSVLLHSKPALSLSRLDAEVQTRGESALLGIVSEFDRWGAGRGILLAQWDEELVAHLARLLFKFFPETKDVDHVGVHLVSKTDEAIAVRELCVARLFEFFDEGSPTALAILRKLATGAPSLRSRINMRTTSRRATQIVHQAAANLGTHAKPFAPPPPLPPSGGNPNGGPPPARRRGKPLWTQLLRLIRDVLFRIPRTNEELLRVVVEVLERIKNNDELAVDHDLFVRSSGSKHEREAVLQAYVFRRLSDLMQGGIVDRESWIPVNNKVDIRIRTSSSERLEIPLEIKWSDDPRTATAASKQLGAKYMADSQRTHGIYLVGWHRESGAIKLLEKIRTDIARFESENAGYRITLVSWPIRIVSKSKPRSGPGTRPGRAPRR